MTFPTLEHIQQVEAEAELLFSQTEVEAALAQMAAAINAELKDQNPLCMSILNGGLITGGLLIPQLNFPLQMDTLQASRYRDTTEGGTHMNWKKYPDQSLAGRCVLLIDDILDQGLTLQAVYEYCQEQGASKIYSAVLLDKAEARLPGGVEQADFVGLTVANRYVFGYGLDYYSYLRNVAGIYAVKGS